MNNINIRKIITAVALTTTLFVQSGGYALAQEINIPTPPPVPTAPPAPTAPPLPSAPPVVSTPPPLPTYNPTPQPTPDPTQEVQNNHSNNNNNNNNSNAPTPTPVPQGNQSGNQNADGGNGSSITTGDATNSGSIAVDANQNLSATPDDTPSGISVINNGNGSDSQNDGSVNVVDNNQTSQNNSANVNNNLNLSTTSGNNSSSANTGGNSQIVTGNANTSGTIITAVNTNVDGVAVSEFNVADDHVGDIILDFGAANCISGCGGSQNASVLNSGNGANSQNLGQIDSQVDSQTFQNNDANVANNMYLTSNSGDNNANRNTGGDSSITTGDANVEANVLTFANNNIAGGVYYGVVNIYGDLVGDIVLPESTLASLGLLNASNTANGSGSANNANVDSTTNNSLEQTNAVVIDNNLNFDANTGDNDVSRNTNGSSSVDSGNANLTAQVLNVANSNVTGGNWWLVIVNEAGQWIGRILGAPEGSNYAGSQGTEFVVGPNGEITAVNSENGADSTNNANVSTTQNNQTVQNNTANIVNNVNLTANTGDNSASRNTGGNSSIVTGDANIIANLVNFVNNNISGSGNLVVTVVNVFGSWLGDFITPGQTKQNNNASNPQNNEHAIGGVSNNSSNNSDSSQTQGNLIASNTPLVNSSNKNITKLAFLGGEIAQKFESEGPAPETLGVATQAYQTENTAANKSIKVNLAWILLAIPALVIYLILRNRRKALAFLPRKGGNAL